MVVKPAIGRKSNKSPPIFSHEFVIQNHADIVSCVVMVFLVGLMVQATSPIASLFITLHHNVSGVDPSRENPKGEQFFYEAGWKDVCPVFFYSLVCIVMHAILQEYFLDKISKKFHLSKSRLSALNESGQLVLFHLVNVLWGGDAILREGFIWNISNLWDGYPHPMSFLLKLWWIVQAAYWLHAVPELYFQRVKKDEWAPRIRFAAIWLAYIVLCYAFRFQRVGVCLIVLDSLSEFVAHFNRLNNILRGEREDYLEKFLSLVNGSVFVAVRLCSLVLGVLTFYFGLAGLAPLPVRVAGLAGVVISQVHLMYIFISETIKQRQESRQLAASRPKKEKKEKPKKEKAVKKAPVEESDLPEVDQNTNKTLRQRQAAVAAKAK